MELLRTHDDFRRLWLAQTVSQIGSQISYLALPLVAAVTLDASPTEMGVLTALGAVPALLIGLMAGAVVDRRERRPVMVAADIARAGLLALIPAAWLAGELSMGLLYTVAFAMGACSLLFDIAYQAYLPSLIDRRQLVAGNSGLEVSRSAAEVVGPPCAGLLVHLVKAPLALAVDAASFGVSAVLVARIRTPEPTRARADPTASLWSDVLAGVREVTRTPALRSLAITTGSIGLFNAMIEAVMILYLTRSIGMQPGMLGAVFAAGSVGFLVGALLPERVAGRFGVGPTLAGAIAVIGLSDLALPLAGASLVAVAVAVGVGQFCFGLGITVFNVAQISLRQALVPETLLGRVSGTLRVVSLGAVPVGAVLGGLLGELLGLRPTLLVAAALEAASALWVWRSPLWQLHEVELVGESA